MDGVHDEKDKLIIDEYIDMIDDWNIYDTWLATDNNPEPINNFLDRIKRNTHNLTEADVLNIKNTVATKQEYEQMVNVHAFLDRDGKDQALANNWGSVHAFITYYMYITGDKKVPPKMASKFAKEMHPKFKYRTSTRTEYREVTEKGKKTCTVTTYTEYLLTEADTMKGHFEYEYEYVTRGTGCNKTIAEELVNVREVTPNRWEKLENYMCQEYKLQPSEIDGLTVAYLNAEEAFYKQQEELAWLFESPAANAVRLLPSVVIPQNIKTLCEEAGKLYKVDPAILMAIAWKETGGTFNPTAYNTSSGATGLMQFIPSTFEAYKKDGDGDGVCNIYSPADAIYTAAYYLRRNMEASGLPIPETQNRQTEKQRKAVYLDALRHYGGVYGTRAAQLYAEEVYELSFNFAGVNSRYAFPLYGYSLATAPISLPFDPAMDSGAHAGKRKGHYGIDFAVPAGTPVLAVITGTVAFAGNGGDAGNFVQILGDDMLMHDYMHLNTITVKKGQVVKKGEQIGTVGNTGYSFGAHLHYGVQRSPYRGYQGATAHTDCINPMPILSNSY